MNSLNRRIAIVCLFLLCLWIVALAVALFSNPPRASAAGPIRVRLTSAQTIQHADLRR